MDAGGPAALRPGHPGARARLARVERTLDRQIAYCLGPSPEPECALSLGPAPELFPQYPPGISRPGTHHGGLARPRSWSPPLPPGAPEADRPGRTGDARALSPVRDAPVFPPRPGYYAGTSRLLTADPWRCHPRMRP